MLTLAAAFQLNPDTDGLKARRIELEWTVLIEVRSGYRKLPEAAEQAGLISNIPPLDLLY